MNKKLSIFLVIFAVLLILNVSAAEFIFDDQISISNRINDNIYAFGSDIEISTEIQRDILMISGNIVSDAYIKEDFSAIGRNIIINKDIKEDLRLIGTDIIIKGDLYGDVVILGDKVLISKESEINNKVMFLVSEVIIDGVLMNGGNITASNVVVNGEIYGDINIDCDKLTFGENGLIKGNLVLNNDVQIDEGKINGSVSYVKKDVSNFNFLNLLYKFLAFFIFAIVFLLLFKKQFLRTRIILKEHILKSLIAGIIALIAIPIIGLILFITIIGIPITIVLMMFYFIMIFSSFIIFSFAIGKILLNYFSYDNNLLSLIIGLILFILLIKIPVVGGVILLIALLIGSGSFVLLFSKVSTKSKVKKTRRKSKKKR